MSSSTRFEIEAGAVKLRHLRAADIPPLMDLNEDPLVMQHITGPQPRTETATWIEGVIAGYGAKPDMGWFAVEEAASGQLVGMAALKLISEGNHGAMAELIAGCREEEVIEIGWRFFPEFWGKGYATASGRALVDYGFRVHALPRLIAMAYLDNIGSCLAIQKCGMSPYGDYEILGRTARMFVITRDEWRGRFEDGSRGTVTG